MPFLLCKGITVRTVERFRSKRGINVIPSSRHGISPFFVVILLILHILVCAFDFLLVSEFNRIPKVLN